MRNSNLPNKVDKYSGTASGKTYVTVDSIGYDQTNKKLGLKVNGADTVIPFSGGDLSTVKSVGRTNTAFSVSCAVNDYIAFSFNGSWVPTITGGTVISSTVTGSYVGVLVKATSTSVSPSPVTSTWDWVVFK